MKKYVLINQDNSIRIMTIIIEGETPEKLIKKLSIEDQNDIKEIKETTQVLPDRVFRNAWEYKDNKIKENLPKAKIIHLNRLKYLREIQLKKLDIEYMLAIETQNETKKTSIVNRKQKLRDLPTDVVFTQIATVAALKKYKPSYLEGDMSKLSRSVF